MTYGPGHFFKRVYSLVTSVPFWAMTISCNFAVFVAAILFYQLEHSLNPQIESFLDAIWWSFSTVTTVGYGDITPQTALGKIIGIILMIGGTGLFATYTALFANAMLGVEFNRLGKRVSRIKRDVDELHDELSEDELTIDSKLKALAKSIERIEKKLNDQD